MKLIIVRKGGKGSGHHGHKGIIGHQGGSLPEGATQTYEKPTKETHAGLIDVKRNPFVKGAYVTIYNAQEAGLDTAGGKYADVCEAHSTISNFQTLAQAKYHLRAVDWCEDCMRINDEGNVHHTKAYKPGAYYRIDLARGSRDRREYFSIGVDTRGSIASVTYDGRNIYQYNGMDAEKFAIDMIENLDEDSKWEELT